MLDPLRADHADELAPVLDDPALHAFTGGAPASAQELRAAYARREGGVSPDGRAAWLNWVLRPAAGGPPAGTVQATVTEAGDGRRAELAWVVATAHQGQGLATEAATAVAGWLARQGVGELSRTSRPGTARRRGSRGAWGSSRPACARTASAGGRAPCPRASARPAGGPERREHRREGRQRGVDVAPARGRAHEGHRVERREQHAAVQQREVDVAVELVVERGGGLGAVARRRRARTRYSARAPSPTTDQARPASADAARPAA